MKRAVIGSLAAALTFAVPLVATAESDLDVYTKASRAVVQEFAESLLAELKSAIEAGGPAAAIQLCNEKAPQIVRRHATGEEWTLGRTSLKFRNPANAPNAWEQTILQSFEERKAAGEDPANIDHAAIVMRDGKRVIQYMKAIPTHELCLNCHGGAEVRPEVAAKLAEFYPNDRARGFKVGDIRGAFTIVQPAE